VDHSDNDKSRVLLIGGTSHTGKSTLAHAVAARLKWQQRSTDKLARHPGRPWADGSELVPGNVARHYLSLNVEELVTDVLRHYHDNVWPVVETLINTHAADASMGGLVLEGSALWPAQWAARTAKNDNVSIIWLTADDSLIKNRILENSRHALRSAKEKVPIEKFIQRTLLYNEQMMGLITQYGFPYFSVESNLSVDELTDRCIDLLTA
jgi:2-phosphoglycerate kinase